MYVDFWALLKTFISMDKQLLLLFDQILGNFIFQRLVTLAFNLYVVL